MPIENIKRNKNNPLIILIKRILFTKETNFNTPTKTPVNKMKHSTNQNNPLIRKMKRNNRLIRILIFINYLFTLAIIKMGLRIFVLYLSGSLLLEINC